MARYEEREVEIECPKCKTKARVKANNFFDSIYSCSKCSEVINVKKIESE